MQGNSTENLKKMIEYCCRGFDLHDDKKDISEKVQRLQYLEEILKAVSDEKKIKYILDKNNYDHLNEMFEKNLFRPLIKKNKSIGPSEKGVKEEETVTDYSWKHIEPIYKIYDKYVNNELVSGDLHLKEHTNDTFIQQYLDLLDSDNAKERDYLRLILYQIYAKTKTKRKTLRKAINDQLYLLIYDNSDYNGAEELLKIVHAIVAGLTNVNEVEHSAFFENIVIPLHKVPTYQQFNSCLFHIAKTYMTKDNGETPTKDSSTPKKTPPMCIKLIEGLLKFWPFANYEKERAFLETLVEAIKIHQKNYTKYDTPYK